MGSYNPESKYPIGKSWWTMSYVDKLTWESMDYSARVEYSNLQKNEQKKFWQEAKTQWLKIQNSKAKEELNAGLAKIKAENDARNNPEYDIPDIITCPRCGKQNCKVSRVGFSTAKAATGWIFFGGIGLLAGAIDSGKLKIDCFSCGNQWFPEPKK